MFAFEAKLDLAMRPAKIRYRSSVLEGLQLEIPCVD
jgi:hypothetical protein